MKPEYLSKNSKFFKEITISFKDPMLSIINSCIDFFVQEERKRCADILYRARIGEIDSDLRSLLHRINDPTRDFGDSN